MLEMALHEGDGFVKWAWLIEERKVFSENFAYPDCSISLPEISPKIFSFNNPFSACPKCHGLGYTMEFSKDLVVDENLTVLKGGEDDVNNEVDFNLR